MKCGGCGEINVHEALLCGKCGNPLEDWNPQSVVRGGLVKSARAANGGGRPAEKGNSEARAPRNAPLRTAPGHPAAPPKQQRPGVFSPPPPPKWNPPPIPAAPPAPTFTPAPPASSIASADWQAEVTGTSPAPAQAPVARFTPRDRKRDHKADEPSADERLARAEALGLYELAQAYRGFIFSYAFLAVAWLVSWRIPANWLSSSDWALFVLFDCLAMVLGLGMTFMHASRMVAGFGCGSMLIASLFFYFLPFSSVLFVGAMMVLALGRFAKEGYKVGLFGPDTATLKRLQARAEAAKAEE